MSVRISGHCSEKLLNVAKRAPNSASPTPARSARNGRTSVSLSATASSISAMYRWKPLMRSGVMYGRNSSSITAPLGARSNIWRINGAAAKPSPITNAPTNGAFRIAPQI
jgi:hypothetical protein